MQQPTNSKPYTSSLQNSWSSQKPEGFLQETKDTLKEKAQSLLRVNMDHEEGLVTRAIEDQTSKIPSIFFLGLALGSMALSLVFASKKSAERKGMANFVGLWAPTFLILGLYNKIVKTQGSDKKNQLNPRNKF